jgi:lambda repressor-like predicted transcriptional regulator
MIIKPSKQRYDEFAIRAELRRRGLTFKVMSDVSGIDVKAFSAAFVKPSKKVNEFIAKSLGIPTHELWPDWFDHDGDLVPALYRKKLSKMRSALSNLESQVA